MQDRSRILVTSSRDATQQPSYLTVPEDLKADRPMPLVVSLHPWSSDLDGSRNVELERLVDDRGWIYLWPNFRGRNDTPEALGSELAQQDILDAIDWVRERYPVDDNQIFLTGESGGGHMTMLMAGRYPDRWAAAVAWVGISDLASWHETHKDGNYGEMIRLAVGGAPGASQAIDDELKARSPITHLANAKDVALEIAAGRHDGHKGSVPIRHSLNAFNTIATARGTDLITDAEIEQMSRVDGHLDQPQPSDQVTDASFGTEIFLRRHAGHARVTIFEGG
ncbi:MAG: prolyl oligopeptidase family serine peptidase, partial [Gemmatimonadetes bacterium]|nr:prolyl oligopeptidase family serine peptidase [Gemmatimonadota bacterium]